MFAFPIHHPQPSVHSTSTTTARTQYERELERLAFLTQQHEQQRRRAEAAARQAALAAYVEEQERRHREEAFERAVQQEVERRRLQQALEHRAALARRAQEERDAALYRQAVVQAAQRRAALVAREQHRRRVEAEQDQRRRIVEARRQQRARQSDFPQSLVQLFLDLANSAAHDEPEQQAVAAPAPVVADKAASSSSRAPSSAAHAEPTLPDPAVEALQKRFERDAARPAALDTLNGLSTEFDSRLSSFTSPSALTFQSPPSPTTSTSPTPPLAFGKPNAAFLGHEDFLVSLLSKVDAVSSGGDKVIKQARKALVKRVEVELAKLDELKEHEWERQSQQAASEAGEGSERAHDDSTAAAAPAPSADTAVAEPESAKVQPATASSSSSPTLDNSDPASVDAPVDQSTRLTAESLASLPSDAANPTSTVPRPRSRASTTSLASDTSSAVDRYVAEMLRRAKDLADRVDAEEEAEKAASAPAPASGESGSPAEASSAPPAAAVAVEAGAQVEPVAAKAPSSAPAATEPLEDGVDEEIDVEATLRLKRSSSATAEPRASDVSAKEEKRAVREEPVEEHEAEDVASEAGTEEFLVV
ncbi:hypothetical protein JCM3775_004504 [Rhodotorula graminis]